MSNDFASRARGIDLYIARLERAYAAGSISIIDLKHVYAGGFLRVIEHLEDSLARLFYGLVTQQYALTVQAAVVRVPIASPAIARQVVLGGRNFVDWLPYSATKERAAIYLRNGLPFTSLTQVEETTLERARLIRNAVAHGGDHAMTVFRRRVIGNQALPPAQRTPEGYLRGQHATNQSRFNALLAQMTQTMANLCA